MYIMKYSTEGHKIRIINIICHSQKNFLFISIYFYFLFLIHLHKIFKIKVNDFQKGKNRRNKNIKKVHNFSPTLKSHVNEERKT